MTTIVYSKSIFAVDRAATAAERASGPVTNECGSCGKSGYIQKDMPKLDYVDVEYGSSRILLVTGSGRSSVTELFVATLEEMGRMNQNAFSLIHAYTKAGRERIGGVCIAITASGDVVSTDPNGICMRHLPGDIPRVVRGTGSGSRYAISAAELGLSPVSAIVFAGIMDPYTGRGIDFVNLQNLTNGEKSAKVYTFEELLEFAKTEEKTYLDYVNMLRASVPGRRLAHLYNLDQSLAAFLKPVSETPVVPEEAPKTTTRKTPRAGRTQVAGHKPKTQSL